LAGQLRGFGSEYRSRVGAGRLNPGPLQVMFGLAERSDDV
jgi:hypothetical protein